MLPILRVRCLLVFPYPDGFLPLLFELEYLRCGVLNSSNLWLVAASTLAYLVASFGVQH